MRVAFLRTMLAIAFAGSVLAAGCGKSAGQKTLCQPGENIFCRCRGGAPGTKTCKDDGNSFDPCVGETGSCDEIASTSDTSSTTTTTTTSTGTGGSGGGAGTKAFLEPCDKNEDCQSNLCPMGYCTKDCASYKECEVGMTYGECIRFDTMMGTVQWCTPYCATQADCKMYGMPSECGYAPTLDAMAFDVCADWGSMVPLPPDGYMCGTDDVACNLGLTGAERVCAFNVCTSGCYQDADCPSPKKCSSGAGVLGSCK